jgi:hypothetical protein
MAANSIVKIFEWAWTAGLNVTLYSKSCNAPHYTDGERVQPRESSDFTTFGKAVAEMPVLRFERGNKYVEVVGANWAELSKQLEFRYKSIAAELLVPKYGDR